MIARLCYCVSPHGEFVCGMLLCAATPARTPTRPPAIPSARTLRNVPGSSYTKYNIYRFISRTSEPLLSSLPLHRIRLSSLQGLINTIYRTGVVLRSLTSVLSSLPGEGGIGSSICQVALRTMRQQELRWRRGISRIGKRWRR